MISSAKTQIGYTTESYSSLVMFFFYFPFTSFCNLQHPPDFYCQLSKHWNDGDGDVYFVENFLVFRLLYSNKLCFNVKQTASSLPSSQLLIFSPFSFMNKHPNTLSFDRLQHNYKHKGSNVCTFMF